MMGVHGSQSDQSPRRRDSAERWWGGCGWVALGRNRRSSRRRSCRYGCDGCPARVTLRASEVAGWQRYRCGLEAHQQRPGRVPRGAQRCLQGIAAPPWHEVAVETPQQGPGGTTSSLWGGHVTATAPAQQQPSPQRGGASLAATSRAAASLLRTSAGHSGAGGAAASLPSHGQVSPLYGSSAAAAAGL